MTIEDALAEIVNAPPRMSARFFEASRSGFRTDYLPDSERRNAGEAGRSDASAGVSLADASADNVTPPAMPARRRVSEN